MTATATRPPTTGPELDHLAWQGFLRRRHQRNNAFYCGGRLTAPDIALAALDDGVNGTFHIRADGTAVITINARLLNAIGFLDEDYAARAARARGIDALDHEQAHQAAAELYGTPPTGDPAADHRTWGWRSACVRLGIDPGARVPAWLSR